MIGPKGYALAAVVGALLLAGALAERHYYGAGQYKAGAAAKRAEIEVRQAAMERGWQEERNRADARYRGAVLARKAAEATVAAQRGRIDGLLRQLAGRNPQAAPASSGLDAAGPDWIGIVGACVGAYEQLGRDAAGWTDQVNGLQGYVRALGVKP